jgi:DNA helicase HerA-like ATPase
LPVLFLAFVYSVIEHKPVSLEGENDIEVRKRYPEKNELALGFSFGTEEDKNIQQLKGISENDRKTHMYVIGGSGTGKTKFLESIIRQDMEAGKGFAIIDPHGALIDTVKGFLALQNGEYGDFIRENVVLLDPLDPHAPVVNFNPLERSPGISSAEQSAALVGVFKKIWEASWGVRMEDLLRNAFIALSENELTIVELPKFLTDESFRTAMLENVTHPICLAYFERYGGLAKRTQQEWSEPVMNKINAILSDERIRGIFSARKSSFNIREVMDSGKIFLVRLDRGRLQGGGDLLGAILVSAFQLAAFSRTDVSQAKRRQFYLYIDEFQNFATDSFVEMLAESRKYGLSLIMAHQNLAQIPQSLRASVMANCGIKILFRLSRDDAESLAKETLPSMYSSGWEDPTQMLQTLPPRVCVAHNKVAGGVVVMHTLDVIPAHIEAEMEEEAFEKRISSLHIGEKYLVPRTETIYKVKNTDPESNRHPAK